MKRTTAHGFTLLEVLLALLIAAGILIVALFYYQQTSQLRDQIVGKSARLTAIRLFFERVTTELRLAVPAGNLHPGLTGSLSTIEFVKTDLPYLNPTYIDTLSSAPRPAPTLKSILYRLSVNTNDLAQAGIERIERACLIATTNMADSNAETTTSVSVQDDTLLIVQGIRFLQWRYWDGTEWLDSWVASYLPMGVEITVAEEMVTTNLMIGETELPEQYRRVVYLPGYRLQESSSDSAEFTAEVFP